MPKQIFSTFKTSTHRPLGSKTVSLSELAQYTEIESESIYDADLKVRKEWRHEIEFEHDMIYLTEKGFRIVFLDGSMLTVSS